MAFVMPKMLPSAQVEQEIWRAEGDLLIQARAFDVYEGAPLAQGQRSVAFRLVFQDLQGTLRMQR